MFLIPFVNMEPAFEFVAFLADIVVNQPRGKRFT
jgi:hypothetical protein